MVIFFFFLFFPSREWQRLVIIVGFVLCVGAGHLTGEAKEESSCGKELCCLFFLFFFLVCMSVLFSFFFVATFIVLYIYFSAIPLSFLVASGSESCFSCHQWWFCLTVARLLSALNILVVPRGGPGCVGGGGREG